MIPYMPMLTPITHQTSPTNFPDSISKRINKPSSDEHVFNGTEGFYNNALKNSGCKQNIKFQNNFSVIREVTGNSNFAGYKSHSKNFCTEANYLKSLLKSSLSRLIFAYLNQNSIRNKFEFLAKVLASNVGLLIISETKIDNSFPKGQFLSKGFCEPFRIDKNIHGR